MPDTRYDDTGGATDAQLCGARDHRWFAPQAGTGWGICYCGARLYSPADQQAWTVFDWDDETTWPADDAHVLAAVQGHHVPEHPAVATFDHRESEWSFQDWHETFMLTRRWLAGWLADIQGPDARIMWTTLPTPPEVPDA